MVFFAKWRPRWKRVAIATAIIAALSGAAKGIHEYKQYSEIKNASNSTISIIVEMEETIKNRMNNLEVNIKLLKDAQDYKTLAEKYVKEGNSTEAEKNYRIALNLFENTLHFFPGLELDYMQKRLSYLKSSSILDSSAGNVAAVERNLEGARQKVGELSASVSGEIESIKGQLAALQK